MLGVSTWNSDNIGSMSQYFGFVATKSRMHDDNNTSNKQYNSRSHHIARDDIENLTVLFPNWFYNRKGNKLETGSGGSATITASVEYPEGVFTQIKFSGNTSTIVANGNNASGFASVRIPRGASFWIREFRVASTAITFLSSSIHDAGDYNNGDRFEYAASGLSDKTMGGTISDTSGSYPRNQACPLAILGYTKRPSVLLVGDSRVRGHDDRYDGSGDQGELARSIGPNFAYSSLGAYGNKASIFIQAGGNERQVSLAQYCTHVICQYGINDITGGDSSGTVIANIQTLWALFSGKKVAHSTICPVSTSTDNWATVANQVSHSSNSVRNTVNDFIRSKPSPLYGFYEVADIVETSRNSGIWKADGVTPKLFTTDGTHESQYGFQKIALGNAIPEYSVV